MASAYLRYPHIHRNQITFVAADDVWVAPIEGGRAWRLTSDHAPVRQPRFSPDGEHIAFVSHRDGHPELMVAGLATGAVTLASTLLDERSSAPGTTSTQEQVLALLTREDPMGLAPGADGMPEDEYGPEAEAIAELLDTGAAPTAAQLDEVWEQWFSQPLSPLLGAGRMDSLLEALSALAPEDPGA